MKEFNLNGYKVLLPEQANFIFRIKVINTYIFLCFVDELIFEKFSKIKSSIEFVSLLDLLDKIESAYISVESNDSLMGAFMDNKDDVYWLDLRPIKAKWTRSVSMLGLQVEVPYKTRYLFRDNVSLMGSTHQPTINDSLSEKIINLNNLAIANDFSSFWIERFKFDIYNPSDKGFYISTLKKPLLDMIFEKSYILKIDYNGNLENWMDIHKKEEIDNIFSKLDAIELIAPQYGCK